MPITDYIVVSNTNVDLFQQRVRDLVAQHYQPWGPPLAYQNNLVQVCILREPTKEEEGKALATELRQRRRGQLAQMIRDSGGGMGNTD